jgi:hypothetical protein
MVISDYHAEDPMSTFFRSVGSDGRSGDPSIRLIETQVARGYSWSLGMGVCILKTELPAIYSTSFLVRERGDI